MLIKCTASIGGNYHNSFSESITKFSRPPLHTHKPSLQDDDKLELILNCLMSAILQQTVAISNLRDIKYIKEKWNDTNSNYKVLSRRFLGNYEFCLGEIE